GAASDLRQWQSGSAPAQSGHPNNDWRELRFRPANPIPCACLRPQCRPEDPAASTSDPPFYLPTRCSRSLLFSLQIYSSSSESGTSVNGSFTVHGFVSALESSTVTSISRCPKSFLR